MPFSCLIIEDNVRQNQNNKEVLQSHFNNIHPISQAFGLKEAREYLDNKEYDMVIADIHLGDGNIFDLFREKKALSSKLIFTTSFSQYAIEAFKLSALSYLLKPYSEEEFIAEVEKATQLIERENYQEQLETFFYNLNGNTPSKRIVLKNHDLIHVVEIDSILYAQADNNYTHFFCEDQKILVSKSLKSYEEQLLPYNFFRCHHSYLVNLKKIKALHKAGDAIILRDKSSVPVASSKKKMLYSLLG